MRMSRGRVYRLAMIFGTGICLPVERYFLVGHGSIRMAVRNDPLTAGLIYGGSIWAVGGTLELLEYFGWLSRSSVFVTILLGWATYVGLWMLLLMCANASAPCNDFLSRLPRIVAFLVGISCILTFLVWRYRRAWWRKPPDQGV